jgi:hypothetical protein
MAIQRVIRTIFVSVLTLMLSVDLAHADSGTLQPVTFASLHSDLKKSLAKMSVRDELVALGCLDGGTDKRTVCNFRLGKFLTIMAESKKGEKDIVGVTMICGTNDQVEALKCLIGYGALIATTAPDMSTDMRGKILKVLTDGLEVGNEISVITDERKYLLQKSMGLWFHVIAADGEGD